jgi:phospholipase C
MFISLQNDFRKVRDICGALKIKLRRAGVHYPFTYSIYDLAHPNSVSNLAPNVSYMYVNVSYKMSNQTKNKDEIDFDLITIAPNPSDTVFNLTFNTIISQNTTVEVYNMLNQKVFFDTINEVKTYQLSLNGLTSGTYLLKIFDGTNSTVKKIIKN